MQQTLPNYFVQVDKKYHIAQIREIFDYKFFNIHGTLHVEYVYESYSSKIKDKIMLKVVDRFNEFDKIYDDKSIATKYFNEIKKEFEPYFEQLRCKLKSNNLKQIKHNIANGISDKRLFNNSADDWRYS